MPTAWKKNEGMHTQCLVRMQNKNAAGTRSMRRIHTGELTSDFGVVSGIYTRHSFASTPHF